MDTVETAYRRHFAAVFRYALAQTGRRDLAEDLTAEAFLQLQHHAATIRLDELPAWLFVVVRNRARDLWRHRQVEQRYVDSLDKAPGAAPAAALVPWLVDEGLTPLLRVCLELHYVWGYTITEIAVRLGRTDGQIKGQVQRALQHLREKEGSGRE